MLIDKKNLENKLCQLIFIPAAIVCIIVTSIFVQLYLSHYQDAASAELKQTSSLLSHLDIRSPEVFNKIADNILATKSYYSISLLTKGRQLALTRGTPTELPQFDVDKTTHSTFDSGDKTTFVSPVAYISDGHTHTGHIAITQNHANQKIWVYKSALYFLGILLCAWIALKFFVRRFVKTILRSISPIDAGLKHLTENNFQHTIKLDKYDLFYPLAKQINTLSRTLNSSHQDLRKTIDQSLIDLKESLETVEIQNIEIDLARKNALKANKSTSEFLANTSHEIRTPINGIVGFANLLRKTPISDKQVEYIDTIEESAKALLININDIIDYSRLTIGKLNLDYKPVDIREIIKDAQRYAIANHRNRDIQFQSTIGDTPSRKLLGDSMRIKQVCCNIMSSAIDLSDENNFTSKIDIDNREDNKTLLKISVSIPSQTPLDSRLQEVTQALNSTDSSDKTFDNKHLMNLMIAKGLAKRMHGNIGLDTNEKEANLWFSVELDQSTHEDNSIESHALNIFTAPHILVVDDNPANSRLVGEILKSLAVAVDTADSGVAAIEKCKDQRYSMILMDIQMPGLNGYETTREIRTQEGSEFRTPIIALTAHAVEDEKAEMLMAGMDDFISKPVGETELRELFHRWLRYSPRQIEEVIKPASTPEKTIANAEIETIESRSSSPQPVNISSCVELAKGNRELAKDMLTMLLHSLKTDIDDIIRHWQEKSYQDLHEVVHRIHGGACYCGVPALLTISAKLDKNLKDKNYEHCETQVEELVGSCHQLLSWQEEHDINLLFSEE